MDATDRHALLAALAAMRSAYVARVRRWPGVGGYEEDVVQDAFRRAAASEAAISDAAIGEQWFFRVLRSAYVDHRRRADTRRRMLVEVANEIVVARQAVPEPPELSCPCLHRGISALRSEYRKALEVVELGGRTLVELAAAAGITPNNAGVRVHRARAALARLTRDCCRGCRTSSDGCSCGADRL
jgi:DNA-directed RNA polymerase specialized sigma24 family protein